MVGDQSTPGGYRQIVWTSGEGKTLSVRVQYNYCCRKPLIIVFPALFISTFVQ